MKVSIVTVCFNSGKTMEDTLKSIQMQTYSDIEYIVIDGLSTDSTNDIVRKYKDIVSIHVIEKDNGLYDAMNKGVSLATGDIVGCLNSDDVLADQFVISNIVKAFDKKTTMVFSDLLYVKENNLNVAVRYWKSSVFHMQNLKKAWIPPHPTFYIKRHLFKKYGLYDISNRFAADYEFMLRVLLAEGRYSKYIPRVTVKMRMGGASNNRFSNVWIQNVEVYKATQKNKLKINVAVYFFHKWGRKITEFLLAKSNNLFRSKPR